MPQTWHKRRCVDPAAKANPTVVHTFFKRTESLLLPPCMVDKAPLGDSMQSLFHLAL